MDEDLGEVFTAIAVFGIGLGWALGSALVSSGYTFWGSLELSVIALLSFCLNLLLMIRIDELKGN
jgi:hypothetical protein